MRRTIQGFIKTPFGTEKDEHYEQVGLDFTLNYVHKNNRKEVR